MKRIALIALVLTSSFVFAQDLSKQSPAERIDAVIKSTGIADLADQPWHLKLEVTLFDEKGANPQVGTIEMWHAGDDRRTIYSFEETTRTDIRSGGKFYHSVNGALPYFASTVLEHTLHPGPITEDLDHAKPELQHKSLGGRAFDCIMLTHPVVDGAPVPLGLFPTFCLQHDTNDLRVSYDAGGQLVVFNTIGEYFGREVPTSITVSNGLVTVAKAKLITLSAFTPTPADFAPAASDISSTTDVARVSGGMIQGARETLVQPIYPSAAKARHVSGTVVFHAIIGRDGHVHSLRPKTYPDPDLIIAALKAVRQWTYKPYLLNGQPTDIDTTITVNFNLN